MRTYLVLGAGPIGRATASSLVRRGHTVKVGTRSGTAVEGAQALTLDATDTAALTAAATGCDAVVICTNPPYHRWETDWPPVIESAIAAAKATGARLVLMGNLYPFGKPTGPMSAATPEAPTEAKGRVRQQLWRMLQASGVPAAELRASDYFGPHAGPGTQAGDRLFFPLLSGKTAWVVGRPDALHSWSFAPDIGECLAILATRSELSGRIWVGPKSGDATLRKLSQMISPTAAVRRIPNLAVAALGLFLPLIREIHRILYQHTETYVLDDSELRAAFEFTPTPLEEAIRATVSAARADLAAG